MFHDEHFSEGLECPKKTSSFENKTEVLVAGK